MSSLSSRLAALSGNVNMNSTFEFANRARDLVEVFDCTGVDASLCQAVTCEDTQFVLSPGCEDSDLFCEDSEGSVSVNCYEVSQTNSFGSCSGFDSILEEMSQTQLILENCPSTCGTCTPTTCIDDPSALSDDGQEFCPQVVSFLAQGIPTCQDFPDYGFDPAAMNFLIESCPRTCGTCDPGVCQDSEWVDLEQGTTYGVNCQVLASFGAPDCQATTFSVSPEKATEFQVNCPLTCGLCAGDGPGEQNVEPQDQPGYETVLSAEGNPGFCRNADLQSLNGRGRGGVEIEGECAGFCNEIADCEGYSHVWLGGLKGVCILYGPIEAGLPLWDGNPYTLTEAWVGMPSMSEGGIASTNSVADTTCKQKICVVCDGRRSLLMGDMPCCE